MIAVLKTAVLHNALLMLAAGGYGTAPERPVVPESTMRTISQDVGIDQNLGAQVPLDLEFRDENGNVVKLGDFIKDKPVILNLVYYRCPMLCTQVMNGLLISSQAVTYTMGDDYDVVSVSIDPKDTPELARDKKQTYVSRYRREGAAKGWHFLTGKQESIDKLAKAVGFRYRYEPRTDQYLHASGIMILTPQGKISRYFYGIDYNPNDLRLGLYESAESRISSPVDAFLLLCYHYDPSTGRYGLAIASAIKIAGIATVALMGVFLVRMYYFERRRSTEVAAASKPIKSAPAGF